MYNIDFGKLIWRNIFEPCKKPKFLAFLQALLSPIAALHGRFIQLYTYTLFDINTNGQVCKLEAGLNKRFDADLKRIEITDGEESETIFIYTSSENHPIYLPQFLGGANGNGFLVKVPLALQNQEAFIKAFINRYKLVTKHYTIIYE